MVEDMRLRVRVSAGTGVYRALEAYPAAERPRMLVALGEVALGGGAVELAGAVRELAAALQGAKPARQEAAQEAPQAERTPQMRALDAAWE